MPKFPKPELYIAHWFTSQWIGLFLYAVVFSLPFKFGLPALYPRYDLKGLGPVGFSVLFVAQALLTMYATLTLYERARSSAGDTLMQDAAWQRSAALHKIGTPGAYGAPGWNPDFPVNYPDPKSYLLVGSYGLIPAALLSFYIAGTVLNPYVSVPVLIVHVLGMGLIFGNEQNSYQRYFSSAHRVAAKVADDDKRLVEEKEREQWRSLADQGDFMLRWQGYKREEEAERLAKMRAVLAPLEARHVRAFAEYVAQADFDGTADRTALRRAYLTMLKERLPADFVALQQSQHPEIKAILVASTVPLARS